MTSLDHVTAVAIFGFRNGATQTEPPTPFLSPATDLEQGKAMKQLKRPMRGSFHFTQKIFPYF